MKLLVPLPQDNAGPTDLLGVSTTTARTIPLPSIHGVRVHIGEDLWAPPLTALQHVVLPPTMRKKSVGRTQEQVNVMFGHTGPLLLVGRLCSRFNSPARRS